MQGVRVSERVTPRRNQGRIPGKAQSVFSVEIAGRRIARGTLA